MGMIRWRGRGSHCWAGWALLRKEGRCTHGRLAQGGCPLAAWNCQEPRVNTTLRDQWHGTQER